jgi:hypothetical protein
MQDEPIPRLLAEHELRTVPAYRLITLRDQDNDADTGGREAIDQAQRSIVASTGYELYISCAQDLIPISVQLEVWSGRPSHDDSLSPSPLTLECPTGQLVLGSPTGDAVGIELTTGPGIYDLLVTAHGRPEAQQQREQILAALGSSSDIDLRATAEQHATLERYTISMWRTAELEDEF